jgi:branched-chain amino acid transport system ATP-binding protein
MTAAAPAAGPVPPLRSVSSLPPASPPVLPPVLPPAGIAESAPALLRLQDVDLSFRGVRVLDGVSLAVRRGEICAVIGPNGAGKSSLFNVMCGVYQPQGGALTFDGETRARMQPERAARRGIARTFQNLALFRGMTVLENVMTGGRVHRRAGLLRQIARTPLARREEAAARAQAEAVLDFLGIREHRDQVVGRLPYGLQKRVDLGRALASRPRLLLLDEPMAGMTFDEKQEMAGFVLDLHAELGTTVVLIEHDMGVVMDLADHLVVLDYGRKIADGAPEEIRDNQAVIDAYLGVAH